MVGDAALVPWLPETNEFQPLEAQRRRISEQVAAQVGFGSAIRGAGQDSKILYCAGSPRPRLHAAQVGAGLAALRRLRLSSD